MNMAVAKHLPNGTFPREGNMKRYINGKGAILDVSKLGYAWLESQSCAYDVQHQNRRSTALT